MVDDNFDFVKNKAIDATNIECFDKVGMAIGLTYSQCKEQIQIIVDAKGFAKLKASEKEIASKWFTISKENRDNIHTPEEQRKLAIRAYKAHQLEQMENFITNILS